MMGNSVAAPTPKTSVSFVLNGRQVVVDGASPLVSLNEWIRAQPGLTGTKKMCGEGGCGCCVVSASFVDQVAGKMKTIAINSCLCPLYSVEGWEITTVEGIGSSSGGFHPIQEKIVEHNGSQCGYCTPGFVMSMYSLLQENPKPTAQMIEDNFDGNICRCTGYRPILDAMKTFAADNQQNTDITDIEDLGATVVCPSTGELCRGHCRVRELTESDPQWFSPSSLEELSALYNANSDKKIKLLLGDTGRGVFKAPEQVDIFIDMKLISQLYTTTVGDSSLQVGAAVSLSNLIGLFHDNQSKSASFEQLTNHLSMIANVPVRNIATWAGNLMLTHDHDNFPSDVFTMMAGVGAKVTIASLSTLSTTELTLWDFLKQDMTKSVIVSLAIPYSPASTVVKSYKVMPRAVNAHAYVNATFSMAVDSASGFTVKASPSIVFGGIGTHAIQASATAEYLQGKSLVDAATLKGALESLEKEIVPNLPPAAASVEYRKSLAISLFFKFYLSAIPDHLSPTVKSAAAPYIRPVSQGQQAFTPDMSNFPVGQPMTKLTAKLQASGEAQYTTDIPSLPDELVAAFVLTTQGNATIVKIDSSAAEQMPGFVKLLTAADIPQGGRNNFISPKVDSVAEEVLAEKISQYAGQSVALVIADTQENANLIAKAVSVEYESLGPPLVTTEDAVRANSFIEDLKPTEVKVGDAKTAISKSDHVISGQVAVGNQYHFHLETHACLCVPEEDGYSVYSSTQWTANVQAAVAAILGIPNNSVDVSVKRCGGGFGAKITRSDLTAAACALGAFATKRPVRMHLDLDTNMKLVGKRFPYIATYEIGSTKEGVVNGIQMTIFCNCGWKMSELDNAIPLLTGNIDNAYHVPNWDIVIKPVKTNTPANCACRSPGTLPGIFFAESMMDHVACSLQLDVEAVKRANLYQKDQVTPGGMTLNYCNITTLWDQVAQSAEVDTRKQQVQDFNKANRWKKHGLSMMPIRFNLMWIGATPYTVLVSIYAEDGTVAVSHGGVEIGQGINTKVAQVAAKTLGIPVEMVKVKPSMTLTNPNGQTTGGSITSEMNCFGTIQACQQLNERIQPIRDKHPDLEWADLVEECYDDGVDLSAKFCVTSKNINGCTYNAYGVAVSEVEVDVLTGEVQILRVDILYDCGQSLNPVIDIGQVEGAFVMGVGYWLTEKIVYDKGSGQLLTHNTWEYKPLSSKDIPIDFRVELLKDAPNPLGVLGSKAVGEPPLALSSSVLFAIKRAVESARADAGNTDHFTLSGPTTVEDVQQYCLVDPAVQFTF